MVTGRVALVTGASGGMGRVVAEVLAEKGCDVAIAYHQDAQRAATAAAAVRRHGRRALTVAADVADESACQALVKATVAGLGRLDILVHAAGPFLWPVPASRTSGEAWRYMLESNLSSAFYLSQAALPVMRRQSWGRLFFFAFAGAERAVGSWLMAAYAAAKVGLVSLARSLAVEEAHRGITVHVIGPGVIEEDWKERRIAEARGHRSEWSLVGRPGTGEDVARVIAFLCEPESDFLTGTVVAVSGGLHIGHVFPTPDPPPAPTEPGP